MHLTSAETIPGIALAAAPTLFYSLSLLLYFNYRFCSEAIGNALLSLFEIRVEYLPFPIFF